MAKNINKKGGQFFGKSHADGGIPLKVKDSGHSIEVEGNEPLIPSEAMQDKNVKRRTGRNIDILNQINKQVGAKGMNEPATEVSTGDAIVCKKSAHDNKKRTYIGTDKQIVSAVNQSNGCKVIESGGKAIEADGKVVQFKKGGKLKLKPKIDFSKIKKLTKEEKEELRQKRWVKKRHHIQELANNIQRLRLNVTKDLKSDKEKTHLTALVIAIMDKTGERIGNETSSEAGHFGITFFRKKHIKIDGNKITLKYVGKSGVDHDTSFSDADIANYLKNAIAKSKGYFIFTTSDGKRIRPERVNRYLSQFNVTSKDMRGFLANRIILEKLKNTEVEEEEKKRKKQLNEIVTKAAIKIGHGRATLKNHYMIPELEYEFVHNGKIIDIKDMGYFGKGGEMKAKSKTLKKVMTKIRMESGGTVPKIEAPAVDSLQGKKGNDLAKRITANEIEKQLKRKLNLWRDDVVTINGAKYKRGFLQANYYRV